MAASSLATEDHRGQGCFPAPLITDDEDVVLLSLPRHNPDSPSVHAQAADAFGVNVKWFTVTEIGQQPRVLRIKHFKMTLHCLLSSLCPDINVSTHRFIIGNNSFKTRAVLFCFFRSTGALIAAQQLFAVKWFLKLEI